jgi:CheY-like chemotaxis protein
VTSVLPAPARVLVADGAAARADALARLLSGLGYAARALADPAALARLAGHHVDLVVLDAALPGGSADALLRRRADDPALRAVPVLVVARADDPEAIARCLALGADDYVCEPLHPVLLGTRVAACLERRRLRETGQRSGRELDVGREIQRGFLPAELPRWPGWELAASFEAARQVSGDFYDAFFLAEGALIGVVVGDVCGKGVGASLFMALFRSLIRAVATQVVRTGRTAVLGGDDDRLFTALHIANDYIAEEHGAANMFATAFAGVLNPRSGVVRWVNAGHDPALVVAPGGGVVARLAPTGPVQLPPSFEFDARVAGRFFAVLRSLYEGPVVCEPRHPSWFEHGARLLTRYEVAQVAADPPCVPAAGQPGGWTGLAYYRLHGSPRTYWSAYSPEALDKLAALLRRRGGEVWCVFDNTAAGAAFENAWYVQHAQ